MRLVNFYEINPIVGYPGKIGRLKTFCGRLEYTNHGRTSTCHVFVFKTSIDVCIRSADVKSYLGTHISVHNTPSQCYQSTMCLDLPMFMPAWEAPLLEPICRPTTDCPARSCSSVNERRFSVDSVGPKP